MVDIPMLSGVLSALKSAGDITKLIIASHDTSVTREKVIELQAQIATAQQHTLAAQRDQSTLLDRVRELEKHVADLEAWGTEKLRYELKAVIPAVFVYAMKPNVEGAEPPHWLCTACYAKGKKSILSAMEHVADTAYWRCQSCAAHYNIPFGMAPGGMGTAHRGGKNIPFMPR
jgi:hypothetical protein